MNWVTGSASEVSNILYGTTTCQCAPVALSLAGLTMQSASAASAGPSHA